MKKYTFFLIAASLSAIIGLIMMNVVIDPYSQFDSPEISHLNNIKSESGRQERGYKITMAQKLRPDLLVLGSSRENYGINPNDIPVDGVKYNGATVSQPYRESRLTLDYLARNHAYPGHILLGLLFEFSDVHAMLPPDFDEEQLYADGIKRLSGLLRMDTVQSSFKTVTCNLLNASCASVYYKSGLKVPTHFSSSLGEIGQHRQFVDNERRYMRDYHYPLPLCEKHPFIDHVSGYSRMGEIRALLRLAYSQKADLKMFIGPSHARQWETIRVSGLWDKFEEWKLLLVAINEDEADKAHTAPFPLWDFSGFHTISSEQIPAEDDKKTRMKYYFESSHYTPEAGRLVIQKMYTPSEDHLPSTFGVQLSSGNIELHLKNLRDQRNDWESSHPADVAEINQLKKGVDAMKQCP